MSGIQGADKPKAFPRLSANQGSGAADASAKPRGVPGDRYLPSSRPDSTKAIQRLSADGKTAAWRRVRHTPPSPTQYGHHQNHPEATVDNALANAIRRGKLRWDDKALGQDHADLRMWIHRLYSIRQEDLAPGVDRQALIDHVLVEICNPTTVAQRDRGTCAATAVQMLLAKEHPAEYIRLAIGLASKEGRVQTVGGAVLTRAPDYLAEDADDDGISRSITGRLFQPALMNLGRAGPGSKPYVNTTDKDPDGGDAGLTAEHLAVVLREVFGHAGAYSADVAGAKGETALQAIARSTAAGKAVLVGVEYARSGRDAAHQLLVTAVKGDRVYYLNPWGQAESMPKKAFLMRLIDYNLQ